MEIPEAEEDNGSNGIVLLMILALLFAPIILLIEGIINFFKGLDDLKEKLS